MDTRTGILFARCPSSGVVNLEQFSAGNGKLMAESSNTLRFRAIQADCLSHFTEIRHTGWPLPEAGLVCLLYGSHA